MAHARQAHRPLLDGAIPLVALLGLAVALEPLRGVVHAVAVLYLIFGAAMATGGADRTGEPTAAWRLYAACAAALAVTSALAGLGVGPDWIAGAPVALMTAGLAVHLHVKAAYGVRPAGLIAALPALVGVPAVVVAFAILPAVQDGAATLTVVALVAFCEAVALSACGRRAHDARIGWILASVCLALVAAASLAGMDARSELSAVFYAIAGWLLTTASVAERPEAPSLVSLTPSHPARPPGEAPAPGA